MKKATIMLLAILSIAVLSCSKNNNNNAGSSSTPPACQTNNTGTIYFQNTQVDPYKLYINGTIVGTVSGGSVGSPTQSAAYTTSAGSVLLKAVQASGYILFPTTYTNTVSLPQCGTVSYQY